MVTLRSPVLTLDQKNRQARGHLYEGKGGPQEKIAESYARNPGQNDPDVEDVPMPEDVGIHKDDLLIKGQATSRANVGTNPPGPGGSHFKGSDYYTPESVPDSISAESQVPPESVTQASRETEGYSKAIHPNEI